MEMIMSSLVDQVTGMLVDKAKEEVVMLLGVPDEIESLHSKLLMISDYLLDAERREIRELCVNRWLNKLRYLMYDAEDIIDECEIEAKKIKPNPTEHLRPRLPLFSASLIYRHEIGNKIKSLNARFDAIIKEGHDFGLTPIPRNDQNNRTSLSQITRKTSPVPDLDLVGTTIEEDTRTLVELLIKDHPQKMPIVVAIVGMGGIGKTTLAQKIFNDEALRAHFHTGTTSAWVCVSQDFDEIKLLREILKGLGCDTDDYQTKAQLEPMLFDVAREKTIFLVLDDLWDARVWENLLKRPLQSCGRGTRILITTRDENIARRMGAMHRHRVDKLSDNVCWSLLKNSVFGGANEDRVQDLSDIGMEIANKCDGLPLAVRTIAGVLRTKDMIPSEWKSVEQNPVWSYAELQEGVMGALYLSYDDLPSYLKPCFIYFALFPEDSDLEKSYIERLWCHEGFVKPLENQTIEQAASEYWKELVRRNLLQPTEPDDTTTCRMHDIVLSLARRLARDECFCGTIGGFANKISMLSSTYSIVKPRRLHVRDWRANGMHESIKQQTSLRTLIFKGIERMQNDDFTTLNCLRILDLSHSQLKELPSSIGELIHLRYLDLSESPDIRELPESIENLSNLRYLDLHSCQQLIKLPKGIENLSNLRYLDLHSCAELIELPIGIENLSDLRYLDLHSCLKLIELPIGMMMLDKLEVLDLRLLRIDSVPVGLNRLRQLKELYGFKARGVDGDGGATQEDRYHQNSTLADLRYLTELTRLSIHELGRVSNRDVARAAALKSKLHLSVLMLNGMDGGSRIEHEVFEELCPPPSLTRLQIHSYSGLEFPSWMMMPASVLPNLEELTLNYCFHIKQIPCLGQLPKLKSLDIIQASSVRKIGPELFFGRGRGGSSNLCICSPSFPSLEELSFNFMENWEEWQWLGEVEDKEQPPVSMEKVLPRLKNLSISWCPELRSLPDDLLSHATSLTKLVIWRADSLREIKNLLFLEELDIQRNNNMETLSNLPSLKSLQVTDCSRLRNLVGLDALQQIELVDEYIKFIPEWFPSRGGELQLSSLQKLEIKGCSMSLLRSCLVDGADWPKIRDIPQVKATSDRYGLGYYISYTKAPYFLDTNLDRQSSSTSKDEI